MKAKQKGKEGRSQQKRQARGSLENEEGKNPAPSSAAVIHEVFGDSSDNGPEEYAAHYWINEKNRSPKYEKNHIDESPVENIVPDEDALCGSEEEGTKTKLKGKAVVPPVASEFPLRSPSPRRDQHNWIYCDFYVTDASGASRLIPPTNIIRWREVRNSDGTTSVESNARFVTWSDGSLQLLIGNEAFCISEQDAHGIESYLFLRHEKVLLDYYCPIDVFDLKE
ncbi:UNVERIFIED_CONTAM: protein LEO1 [Sesamum radiatum]|uniref:Protein LEO1 n=1 Tax=Sesamum radiatum TaxID=300843 RepID=A0AAW2PLE4_SESRA